MKFPTNALAISLLFFATIAVGAAFYGVFHGFRLLSYIKKVNYSRWAELTSIGSFGPGLHNAFRTIPYIYGNTDNEDERIARHKDSIRVGNRFFLLSVIAFLVNMWLLLHINN